MSEYQYYEFLAIDRPLDGRQMDELRQLSTRAEITPTCLVNTYHWGNFKGDPRKLMWSYFDAFVYVANWGTHRLILRLPRALVDVKDMTAYEAGDTLTVEARGDHVLVEFGSDDEGGDWEETGETCMASLSPLREALLAGDFRALYLGWLAAARAGGLPDKSVEPPVPPGLGRLNGALAALAEFLRVDDDLLGVAAARSAAGAVRAGPGRDELAKWLGDLPAGQKDAWLLDLAQGEPAAARLALLGRFRAERKAPVREAASAAAERRTVGQLVAAADAVAAERSRAEAARRAAERERQAREAAAAREERLAKLAQRQDHAWLEVETMIATKQQAEYERAVDLLKDLRDVAARGGTESQFAAKIRGIYDRHAKKSSFLNRLQTAGLVPTIRIAT
jgi:hypothetical protein